MRAYPSRAKVLVADTTRIVESKSANTWLRRRTTTERGSRGVAWPPHSQPAVTEFQNTGSPGHSEQPSPCLPFCRRRRSRRPHTSVSACPYIFVVAFEVVVGLDTSNVKDTPRVYDTETASYEERNESVCVCPHKDGLKKRSSYCGAAAK